MRPDDVAAEADARPQHHEQRKRESAKAHPTCILGHSSIALYAGEPDDDLLDRLNEPLSLRHDEGIELGIERIAALVEGDHQRVPRFGPTGYVSLRHRAAVLVVPLERSAKRAHGLDPLLVSTRSALRLKLCDNLTKLARE